VHSSYTYIGILPLATARTFFKPIRSRLSKV
jgi:hypothetical protein